jgi:hypothetical protein
VLTGLSEKSHIFSAVPDQSGKFLAVRFVNRSSEKQAYKVQMDLYTICSFVDGSRLKSSGRHCNKHRAYKGRLQ